MLRLGRSRKTLFVLILVLVALTSFSPAHAYPRSQTGRWTPPSAWCERAIHLALLRGEGSPYHSKILWFCGQDVGHSGLFGGVWGWRPGEYTCSSYPDSTKLNALAFSAPGDATFCGGATQLGNGQLQEFGGTQGGTEFGIKQSALFDQSTGTWTSRDSMHVARWYPSSTTLATGEVLVLSGSHNQDVEIFGGLSGSETSPSDSSLVHYSNAGNGAVDGAALPAPSQSPWPSPRIGHSAVFDPRGDQLSWYFGGKRQNQTEPCDELWQMRRRNSPWRADYYYDWQYLNFGSAAHPGGRMNHVAVWTEHPEAQLLIFGGTAVGDTAASDVWRLWYGTGYTWTHVPIYSVADGPGTRTGLAGFWHSPSRSLIVFGGTSSPGGTPTDSSLYCLTFASDFSSATWRKLSAVGPSPRTDFGFVYESEFDTPDTTHAFVFGGQLATGFAGDLWDLWLKDDPDSTKWTKITDLGGNWPTARKGSGIVSAGADRRLYLFGGSTFDGHLDDTVYVARLKPPGGSENREWTHYARNIDTRYGHTMLFEGVIYQRKPEIYSPATNTFTQLDSPHLHQWFPQVFVWKPDAVFIPGPADTSLVMSLSTGEVTAFPDTGGFPAGNAVMYSPGKVMMTGTRDTQGGGGGTVGTTKFIDLNQGDAARWHTSGSMLGRVNHNLVLLPNGKVLVVGGTSVVGNTNPDHPVKQPEIWSPPSDTDADGSWSGNGVLASQMNLRDYHSTALLLPDGRVLSASGNADTLTRASGEIFCPPYLFSGDSLAVRPTLISATGRWRYNTDVTFSVSGDTVIRRACLIHAGATTHAQDQAQRYVPLTLLSSSVRGDGVRQYFLKAPIDSFAAPPGDYLLFVSDLSGVPSIAQWVRVGSQETALFDTTAPDALPLSTSFIYCNAISPITWTAPGDDYVTGTALSYDIRWSASPINSSNFASATPLDSVGIPLLAGTVQAGAGFYGLGTATTRYVAGKTRDKAGNWSTLATASFTTLSSCGGGGGGFGESAQRTRGGEGSTVVRVPGELPFEDSGSAQRSSARLVAEFEAGEPCAWRISQMNLDGNTQLLSATLQTGIVQEQVAGGWSTTSRIAFPAGPVGVRSLPRNCRLVFPAGSTLEAVELQPRGFECWGSSGSRLGDLKESVSASARLAPGDEIRFLYAHRKDSNSGEDCFFRVLIPGALTASRPAAPAGPTASLPTSFALHRPRPNPFSRTTTFSYDLPVGRDVKIELFDVQGRRITTLQNGRREAGRYTVEWNGQFEGGGRVGPAIYIVRMSAGDFRAEQRVTLLP